jgi:hypothetical protein
MVGLTWALPELHIACMHALNVLGSSSDNLNLLDNWQILITGWLSKSYGYEATRWLKNLYESTLQNERIAN